ncbi:MAG: glycosyltransferase family 9 protein [Chloroflexota bacterium]|nr:glycosyltransferase family 9 protein [Chloroflexota bacterium]
MTILPAWRSVRNVLLVRLDNLGDVLVTTPAFHAVRESLPGARLTLLTSGVGAQAGQLNPDLDQIIEYAAPWMDPWGTLPLDAEREQRAIAVLREGNVDAAIIFTSFRQSSLPAAYLCYLAGIPLRAAASIDGPGSLLTTRHKHPERMMHEVERGLDLVSALGMETPEQRLVLRVPEPDRWRARQMLSDLSDDGPAIVLHPGCSMPSRTYPWEQYAEIADLLVERLGATVILTGTEGERELVDRIRARMRREAVCLAGELPFPMLCGLIEASDIAITNNTGPMHIAAAMGTPVVALFALTNPPEQWGPWMVPHRQLFHDVPCRICYSRVCPFEHECLRLVTPEMVIAATGELLTEVAEGCVVGAVR